MWKNVLILLSISISSYSQIIRIDTLVSDKVTEIQYFGDTVLYFTKTIFNKDTARIKDNNMYYDYVVDNYRDTECYLTRDTISEEISHLEFKVVIKTNGCFGRYTKYIYIYYDKKINKKNKGILVVSPKNSCRILYHLRDKPINKDITLCTLYDKDLNYLISLFNYYMIFNKTKHFEKSLDDIFISTTSTNYEISILVNENTRFLKNTSTPNPDYFVGLHEKILYNIDMFVYQRKDRSNYENYFNFFKKRKRKIKKDLFLKEMFNQFLK